MNEDYNILEKALLYAPEGTQLWSDVDGWVELDRYHDRSYLRDDASYAFSVIHVKGSNIYSLNGHYCDNGISSRGNCVLWPSKDHRTWVNWQSVLFKAGTFIYNVKQKKVKIFHHSDTVLTYTGKLSDGSISFGALGDCRFASREQIEQFKKEQSQNNKVSMFGDLMDIAIRAAKGYYSQDYVLNELYTWNAKHDNGLNDEEIKMISDSLNTSISNNK